MGRIIKAFRPVRWSQLKESKMPHKNPLKSEGLNEGKKSPLKEVKGPGVREGESAKKGGK